MSIPSVIIPSSSSSLPPYDITHLQRRIIELEDEIKETKLRRDKHVEGSDLWIRADNELIQLRTKEDKLLDELHRIQSTGN